MIITHNKFYSFYKTYKLLTTCTSFQSSIMSSVVSLDLIYMKEGFRTWNRQNSNCAQLEDNESNLDNKASLISFLCIISIQLIFSKLLFKIFVFKI
jgi:hypothetical protein